MTVESPSPEVLVERVKMALAEAGWPDVSAGSYLTPTGRVAVGWQATEVAGVGGACFSCSERGQWTACESGDCQAGPDEPRRPPRELLLRREP